MASKRATGSKSPTTYEEAIAALEAIVARIESGEIGLEESMTEYERGVELVQRCREILAKAEQRVTDLTARMRETETPGGAGKQG